MSLSAEAIRQHHRALSDQLAALLSEDGTVTDPAQLVRFLDEELLPHAEEEERELYDRIEPYIPPDQATLTMRLDHAAIRRAAEELRGLVARLATASAAEREQLERQLLLLSPNDLVSLRAGFIELDHRL